MSANIEWHRVGTLTAEEVEAIWADVKRLYEHSVPNVYPAAYARLRAPFDLALRALSAEKDAKRWHHVVAKAVSGGTVEIYGSDKEQIDRVADIDMAEHPTI